MEQFIPSTQHEDAETTRYVQISKLVSDRFEHNLYSPTIIEDVMGALKPEDRNALFEDTIRDVVFNRQLIRERFR